MRIRKINADQNSAEFDQLRRTVNNILRMMETAKASITATATAEEVLTAWADAIETGVDNDPNDVATGDIVVSNGAIVGLKPVNGGGLPRHPMLNRALVEDDSFDV